MEVNRLLVSELFTLISKQEGGQCSINYSESCGFCVEVNVFGEPAKSMCTKDMPNVNDALENILKLVRQW